MNRGNIVINTLLPILGIGALLTGHFFIYNPIVDGIITGVCLNSCSPAQSIGFVIRCTLLGFCLHSTITASLCVGAVANLVTINIIMNEFWLEDRYVKQLRSIHYIGQTLSYLLVPNYRKIFFLMLRIRTIFAYGHSGREATESTVGRNIERYKF